METYNTLRILDSGIKCIYTDSKYMLLLGLAMCTKYNDVIKDIYGINNIEFNIQENENIILISTHLTEGYLTEDELGCIIAHEEGHILNGDLDAIDKDKVGIANEYDETKEHLADLHAVTKYGKDVFRFSLIKVAAKSQAKCLVRMLYSKVDKSYQTNLTNKLANRILLTNGSND